MFNRLCYLTTISTMLVFAGCGYTTYESSDKVSVKNSQTEKANEADVDWQESEAPAQELEPTNQTKSEPEPDVREVGPPDPPQNANTDEKSTTPSVLKKIPVPTEEEPVEVYVEKQTIDIPKNWTRVTKVNETEVWVDVKAKQVMVAGRICVQEGGLEMFICPFFTKEHESVVAVNARSFEVHTALLAVGAKPGKPVQWHPEYKAATGPIIEIDVMWKDEAGKIITRRGQEMVQNFRTEKPMKEKWIFGGSEMETDEETGETFYYGDGGELVCLSNFSTATIDVTTESSDANGDLIYAAIPKMIPKPGTKVYVIFKPEIKKAEEPKPDADAVSEKDQE